MTRVEIDPKLHKGSQKETRSNIHTTGLYGFTANGTPMSAIYIFDTKTKDDKKFQVKASWCQNLPKIRRKNGLKKVIELDSYVGVRRSGCTEEKLMQPLIENFICLYIQISRRQPLATKMATLSQNQCYSRPILGKADSQLYGTV